MRSFVQLVKSFAEEQHDMRIFVTGTTGYIGASLAQSLIAQGHTVIGFARSDEAEAQILANGLQVHRGNVAQPDSVREIIPQVDAVIHVAVGLPRGVTEADAVFVEAIVDGLKGTGKLFIMTSGLGVYAGVEEPYVDEATVLAPRMEMQALRVKIEERVIAAAEQGIRSIVLRPAHVYGRGNAGILIRTLLATARQSRTGAFIGDGTVPIATVHIDDLIEAFNAAIALGKAGQKYNVVSDQAYMKDLATAVSYAVGGNGETLSLTAEEAQKSWGPLAGLYGSSPIISGTRAVVELGWKATAPSVVYELAHGSLATRPS
jgi:nucleoside-diphosphate-sugar epimerase